MISWEGNVMYSLAKTTQQKHIVTATPNLKEFFLEFIHNLTHKNLINHFTHLNFFPNIFIQLFKIFDCLVENLQGWCATSLYSYMDLPLHWMGHCVATELHSRAAMKGGGVFITFLLWIVISLHYFLVMDCYCTSMLFKYSVFTK